MSGPARHRDGWLPVFLIAAFLVLTLGSRAAWPAMGGGHGGGHGGGSFREAESSGVAAPVEDQSRTGTTTTVGHSSCSRTSTTPTTGTTRTILAMHTTRTATRIHLTMLLNTATGTVRRTAAAASTVRARPTRSAPRQALRGRPGSARKAPPGRDPRTACRRARRAGALLECARLGVGARSGGDPDRVFGQKSLRGVRRRHVPARLRTRRTGRRGYVALDDRGGDRRGLGRHGRARA